MKTLIVTDARVNKYNNKYYTENTFYSIIARYAKKFENITLATRIIETKEIPNNFCDITDLCDKFEAINSLKGVLLGKYDKEIKYLIEDNDFLIARVHSLISFKAVKYARKANKPYLTEAMGDAWDAYWNHGILGKMIAPYGYIAMKKSIWKANYATYVTQKFLQNRYPCKNESVGVSKVSIKTCDYKKKYSKLDKKNITILTAAAVDVKYKGQRLVIKAIRKLKKKNINIKYYLAGKGDNTYLKKIAKRNNALDSIIFLGPLTHEEVLEKMKKTDIYIQPSLQEGLPRSLIEAMSCGCVCLGSTTAGIPELLDKKYIFKRGRVNAIVESVQNVIQDDWEKISERNIEKSNEFLEEKLNERRFLYYDKINKELKEKYKND